MLTSTEESDCNYPYFIDEETKAYLRKLRGFAEVTKLEFEKSDLKLKLISKPLFLTTRSYCLIIQASSHETLALYAYRKMRSLELTKYLGFTSSLTSQI